MVDAINPTGLQGKNVTVQSILTLMGHGPTTAADGKTTLPASDNITSRINPALHEKTNAQYNRWLTANGRGDPPAAGNTNEQVGHTEYLRDLNTLIDRRLEELSEALKNDETALDRLYDIAKKAQGGEITQDEAFQLQAGLRVLGYDAVSLTGEFSLAARDPNELAPEVKGVTFSQNSATLAALNAFIDRRDAIKAGAPDPAARAGTAYVADADNIKKLEQAIKANGDYDPGAIDGKIDGNLVSSANSELMLLAKGNDFFLQKLKDVGLAEDNGSGGLMPRGLTRADLEDPRKLEVIQGIIDGSLRPAAPAVRADVMPDYTRTEPYVMGERGRLSPEYTAMVSGAPVERPAVETPVPRDPEVVVAHNNTPGLGGPVV